jgi:pyridoxine 5-phosphate synthase
MAARPMPRLSVNLNKIALLRNSRRTGVPDVLRFAALAYNAGADGITVHPRPDERHIRRDDVFALADLIRPWRPHFELNLEGYPDERFLNLCSQVRPEQCTIVPDPPTAFTSEEGWKLDDNDSPVVSDAVSALKSMGCRVIVFVDPDADVVERVRQTGADGIEIYTGAYATEARSGSSGTQLRACAAAAQTAIDRRLVVNVGHDLNLENLPPLVSSFSSLAEASIGHELTADALEMGFERAVIAYKVALQSAR